MDSQESIQHLRELVEYQKKILAALEKSAPPQKDLWDRFSAVSTVLSGLIIAAMGWYFTQSYNNRQAALLEVQNQRAHDTKQHETRVLELQTVEKFIPHLSGTDETAKMGAMIAVATLGNQRLASQLGTLYASPGSIEAIEALLQVAEEASKTSLQAALVTAYFMRAKQLIDSGSNLDRAIKDYNQIHELETAETIAKTRSIRFLADTYNNRGYAYFLLRQYDAATKDLMKALDAEPNYNLALLNLARVYERTGEVEKALTYFGRSLQSEPSTEAYTERGRLYARQGEGEKAIADFQESIALNPDNFRAFYQLGLAYAQQGNHDEMAKAFARATRLALDPEQQQWMEQLLDTIERTAPAPTLLQQMRGDIEKMKHAP